MAHSHFIKTEKQALTISLIGCIIFAIFGIGFGLFVGSRAIMLDGIFSLFSMGMTGLGLVTAYVITRPCDDRFQYGYAHLEPITNVINGSLIMVLCLIAFYSGISSLLEGGRPINLGMAVIYSTISTLFCATLYFLAAGAASRLDSELVLVDSKEWLVDTLLSATLLIGFIIASFLDTLGWGHVNHYIDPALVALLALIATAIPIKVLRRNLKEILRIAPTGDVSRLINKEVENLRQRYNIQCNSHLMKSGRAFHLELNILVPMDQTWSIQCQDKLRHELWDRLGETLGENAWFSICFTHEDRWL